MRPQRREATPGAEKTVLPSENARNTTTSRKQSIRTNRIIPVSQQSPEESVKGQPVAAGIFIQIKQSFRHMEEFHKEELQNENA
jgi:hypothetical protein